MALRPSRHIKLNEDGKGKQDFVIQMNFDKIYLR
jgi:hypothetical protein